MRFSSTNWGDYLFSQNVSEMLFFISIWNVYCAPNTLEQEMCVRLPVHVCVGVFGYTREGLWCVLPLVPGPVYVSLLHISRWYVCQFLVSSLFLLH